MKAWRNHPRRLLLGGGAVLVALGGLVAVTLWLPRTTGSTVTATHPGPPTSVSAPRAPPTTTQTTAPSLAPVPVSMSWDDAGGIVWHAENVDPVWLGQEMRAAGFGWVAVYLGEGDSVSPPEPSWIARFRAASGLPVGGWAVLGVDPATDAAQAVRVIQQDELAFYIADAEAPYGYTDGETHSPTRFARSRVFVSAFREAEPELPAAISSYCRPDEHDLDWAAWARGGFAFLPQAYVNDFGAAVSPAVCARAAAGFFPRSQVHPTVGSYSGVRGIVDPARLAQLLAQAGTTGFSVYPAEAGMDQQGWQAYGNAIMSMHIAGRVD